MRKGVFPLVLAASCAGDPSDVAHQGSPIAVVDTYEKEFAFDAPVPCQVFIHRRVTDEQARYVEYDARMADVEVTAVYSIDAPAARPLRVEIFRGMPGFAKPSFRVEAADHDLQAIVDDELRIAVAGYAARAPARA